MIFKTERLLVRKLTFDDLEPFHQMQSNANVMKFVRAKKMNYEENKKDLQEVIEKYNKPTNNFYIHKKCNL